MNIGLVFFFEYMCLTSFADRFVAKMLKENPDKANEYIYKHGYIIFTFCYQIGVFLSRSSLSLFKIKRVEIMTIL